MLKLQDLSADLKNLSLPWQTLVIIVCHACITWSLLACFSHNINPCSLKSDGTYWWISPISAPWHYLLFWPSLSLTISVYCSRDFLMSFTLRFDQLSLCQCSPLCPQTWLKYTLIMSKRRQNANYIAFKLQSHCLWYMIFCLGSSLNNSVYFKEKIQ